MSRAHHEALGHESGHVEAGSERSFGLVFAAVFLVVAIWPLVGGGTPRWWALAPAALCAGLGLFAPRVLKPLNRAWLAFGHLLNRIVSPLVLGVMFYLVITPTGLLMRALGRDPLRLSRDPEAESYWIERRPPGPSPDSMKNQF